MNIPNRITLMRMFLIPVLIILLYFRSKYLDYAAAAIFILLAATDALDGYIARKTKQVTRLGKLMDPLADKLLISAALIFLIKRGIPEWMAFVIIAREFAVTGLRLVAQAKGTTMEATGWGKVKTFSQIVAIVAVMINFPFFYYFILTATIITVISGIVYFYNARSMLKENE